MNKQVLTKLSEIVANGVYIIDSEIDVTFLSEGSYIDNRVNMYTFPENVTLIFTGAGFLNSNRPFRLRGNNTSIVASSVPVFGENLDVTAFPYFSNIIYEGYDYSGNVARPDITGNYTIVSAKKEDLKSIGLDSLDIPTHVLILKGDIIGVDLVNNDGTLTFDCATGYEYNDNSDGFLKANNGGAEYRGWICEYIYPEWFESSSDDDSIIINKALLMNCMYLGERYCKLLLIIEKGDDIPAEARRLNLNNPGYSIDFREDNTIEGAKRLENDLHYNPLYNSDNVDAPYNIPRIRDWNDYKMGLFYGIRSFVKLLGKKYTIKNPIFMKGSSLIGSGIGRSIIKCDSINGNWDIKRCVIIGGDWNSPRVYIWKRAAIILPTSLFTSVTQSRIQISDFSLDLLGIESHGIILERIQDNSYIHDLDIVNTRPFYSALRIEPAAVRGHLGFDEYYTYDDGTRVDIHSRTQTSKNVWNTYIEADHFDAVLKLAEGSSILCDAWFKPIPHDVESDFYTEILNFKVSADANKDSGTRTRRLNQLSAAAHNEGAMIERVYATHWTGRDSEYKFTTSYRSSDGKNHEVSIYGAFPNEYEKGTHQRYAKWQDPTDGEWKNSEVTEFDLFTPNGGNTGMLYLNSVNETTIQGIGFSPCPANIYNYASGVAVELVNCSRINVTDAGAGFCRIGYLIRSLGSTCKGINFTDNIYEGMQEYIVATYTSKPYRGSRLGIYYINIKGGNYHDSGRGNMSNAVYYIDSGAYHTIIDAPYTPYLKLGKVTSDGIFILKRIDDREGIGYCANSDTLKFDPTKMIMSAGTYYSDCYNGLIRQKEQLAAQDKDYSVLLRLINSFGAPAPGTYTRSYPNNLLICSTDGRFLVKNETTVTSYDTNTIKALIAQESANYVKKSEAEGMFANAYVNRYEFISAIEQIMSNFPGYTLSFENDVLILRKDGIITNEIRLPYVKAKLPKVVDTIGLESCLGKGQIVTKKK